MRYTSLIAIAVLTFVASPASASLTITGGAGEVPLPITGNDFNGDLAAAGVTHLYSGGANVLVAAPGTIQFYYHGAESGNTNQFRIGGVSIKDEANEGWLAGLAIGAPLAVTTGDTFSSLLIDFNVLVGSGVIAPAGSVGFGVFKTSTGLGSDTGYTRIYLGYDDRLVGAGGDDNHDDMIVSAVFTPAVPEAATIVVWSVLGLIGFYSQSRRRLA